MLMIPIRLRKMSLVMWTRMSVGTLAEAEMDPDKYDKADANVSEADRRKIKNIDQPKGINRKWLVPIFLRVSSKAGLHLPV